jgi:hypothetical protein
MLGFAIDSIDEITCDDRIREEALLVIWLPSLEVDFGGIAKLFLVKKKNIELMLYGVVRLKKVEGMRTMNSERVLRCDGSKSTNFIDGEHRHGCETHPLRT